MAEEKKPLGKILGEIYKIQKNQNNKLCNVSDVHIMHY